MAGVASGIGRSRATVRTSAARSPLRGIDGRAAVRRAAYSVWVDCGIGGAEVGVAERAGCTRDELYELVWSEPMTRVSARFGVSGSYLARVCAALGVPRPARGHWAKLEHGKAAPRPTLPAARPGEATTWSPGDGLVAAAPAAPLRTTPPSRVRIASDAVHHLVGGAKALFELGRPVEHGAYLKPHKRLLPDVNASGPCLDRALALANGLFNGLEARGHRVVIAPAHAQLCRERVEEREAPGAKRPYWEHNGMWSPQRPTVTYVGTVAIGLAIVEMSERVLLRYVNGGYIRDSEYAPPRSRFSDHSFTTTREIPSGRLRIVAYSPYGQLEMSEQWQETARSTLDGGISSIVRSVERMAGELVKRMEEVERQAEIQRQAMLVQAEKRRREDDRRRVAESVRDSAAELERVIEDWWKAMAVEAFLAAVGERARRLPHDVAAPLLGRLAVARDLLGDRDPLDVVRAWRTPAERHVPMYPDGEGD